MCYVAYWASVAHYFFLFFQIMNNDCSGYGESALDHLEKFELFKFLAWFSLAQYNLVWVFNLDKKL